MGHLQRRASVLQKTDTEVYTLLFSTGKTVPPFPKFIGEFDLPSHALLCHKRHYVIYGIEGRPRYRCLVTLLMEIVWKAEQVGRAVRA